MKGWRTMRLDECCDIVSGATPSTSVAAYWDGDINWVTPKDLSDLNGPFISDTPRKISRAGLEACAATVLAPGSVLFSSRAPIGHVAINTTPMATNQGFKSFAPRKDRMNEGYLYHWLRFNRAYLEGLGNGATFKEVSKAVVSRIELPVPPLQMQRRIAAILDEADALRAKRRVALTQLDAMARATFVEMFGDVVSNSKGWESTRVLGDVADIASGITKGRKDPPGTLRAVPYLAVANVQDHSLKLDKVKEIEVSDDEIERYKLEIDDLVLTEGGDPDKLGRGALWNNEIPECIHQNHIFRVRLTSVDLHPVFLNWIVGSARGKAYFIRSAKQTTGIASINMTQLRAFPLLVPPVHMQIEFVRRLKALGELKHAAQKAQTELDSLFASLQHRAFRGEL